MEPKYKARELVDNMSSQTYSYQPFAGASYIVDEIGFEAGKKCALIAVDEIITQYNFLTPNIDAKKYWIEVKQEIENL